MIKDPRLKGEVFFSMLRNVIQSQINSPKNVKSVCLSTKPKLKTVIIFAISFFARQE